MKPGRELDVFVHEKVLGLCHHEWLHDGHGDETVCSKCRSPWMFTAVVYTPKYSTEMGAAWQVVEKLHMAGSLVSIYPLPDGTWVVTASKVLNPRGDGTADDYDDTMPEICVQTPTPAHGICLVAVRGLLGEGQLQEYLVGETAA